MRYVFPCVETTADVETVLFAIRLWVNVPVPFSVEDVTSNDELIRYCEDRASYYLYNSSVFSLQEITVELAVDIAQQPNVNAVQVKNKRKNNDGVMIYSVPFEETKF